jgi:hypothetical protein
MSEFYNNLKHLKNAVKSYYIKVISTKDMVILEPKKKYVKEYADGDYTKAIEDLTHWFGILGRIREDGSVEMFVRKEGE